MHVSTVKWFDAKKGYGFIHHPDGGDDIFVHYSNIQSDDDFKTLQADQEVQFEMNEGPKGLNASNVVASDGAAPPSSSETDSEPDFEIDPAEIDPTAEVDPVPTE
jgi:CspA family cold shock protein